MSCHFSWYTFDSKVSDTLSSDTAALVTLVTCSWMGIKHLHSKTAGPFHWPPLSSVTWLHFMTHTHVWSPRPRRTEVIIIYEYHSCKGIALKHKDLQRPRVFFFVFFLRPTHANRFEPDLFSLCCHAGLSQWA